MAEGVVATEMLEQKARGMMTVEQRLQSDARNDVLKHFRGVEGAERASLESFAARAADNVLKEYESLKKGDPALQAAQILDQNRGLFRDPWHEEVSFSNLLQVRRVSENARRIRTQATESGKVISDDEIVKAIRPVGTGTP